MIETSYWWDQAEKFRDQARATDDRPAQQELLELARICDDVAAEAEDRATGG